MNHYSTDSLGDVCHWCGGGVGYVKRRPKRGKHLFCSDLCRVTHHRAFKRYHKRAVTLAPGDVDGRAQLDIKKRNKPAGGPIPTSSPAIRQTPGRKRNVEPAPWDGYVPAGPQLTPNKPAAHCMGEISPAESKTPGRKRNKRKGMR